MSAISRNLRPSTIAQRARRRLLLVPPDGKTINTYLPWELLRKIFLYSMQSNFMKSGTLVSVCRYWRFVITTINACLPMELLREIFLYSIESNETKYGQLASVCRYWRSVISSMAHLWSTLRVGTWSETEQVTTWLQRAYPKKIIIDPQRDSESPSEAPMFAALQNSLTSTGQWQELTISSFPPEHLASQLGVQVANPMNMLKVLHVSAGCVDSPSLAHLLNLIPTGDPLCELKLHSPFASTHFLQPRWFPVLKNLTVLTVNGGGIHEPFEHLPMFTQLQTFEADRLRLPFYEPNTNLPLLCTLRKLQLRACSVQWMAGRQFSCLEECAILLPRHWEIIQQHEVQLPSCKKLAYHGYPMTTARYFHVPEMRAMDLRSHDCNEQRVYRHLRHLFREHGRISNLTTLHLTFRCSEQVLIKVLKYLIPLQELVLSIAYPSHSWQSFLESLAAKPSTNEWPTSERWMDPQHWEQLCSSQTWNANILPHLKYLGIQSPRGISRSECLDNLPFLRLVGWTRAHLTPPLEHLKGWEGSGNMDDIAVDSISTGYLDKHLGISSKEYDAVIVKGIVTGHLDLRDYAILLLQLHSTVLFRNLQHLELSCDMDDEIPILPYLEQIKEPYIHVGRLPRYSLSIELPLTHTLQRVTLRKATSSWMYGRTFKALIEFHDYRSPGLYDGPPINLPACTALHFIECPIDYFPFLSCSNVQNFRLQHFSGHAKFDLTHFNSLHGFLFTLSCLQDIRIKVRHGSGIDSLLDFVFCDARDQGVWRDIKSVEVEIMSRFFVIPPEAPDLFNQTVRRRPRYEKWWKTFTVTMEFVNVVKVNASRAL
jgi:hypothetical protein